jgi:hypothetical protein
MKSSENDHGLTILFKRSDNNLSRFFEMFESERTISFKEVKKAIISSDISKVIMPELHDINRAARIILSGRDLITLRMKDPNETGPLFKSFELLENLKIQHQENYFVVTAENKEPQINMLVKRSNNSISKLLQLYVKRSLMPIKNIKRHISASSFYKVAIHEIETMNEAVKQIDPTLDVFRPALKRIGVNDFEGTNRTRKGTVVQALELNPDATIIHTGNYFIITIKRHYSDG